MISRAASIRAASAVGAFLAVYICDREIPVSPVAAAGGAQQRVDLTMLAEGAWKAQIAWTAHGQSYYAEREIAIK